jgi:nuclease S1
LPIRMFGKGVRIFVEFLLLIAFVTPGPALAWGRIGHRAVAKMAEVRLTPAARAAIRAILGPGLSLADVSTWADEQRELEESYRWHFVNVPISADRYDARYCPRQGCVVSKIEDFRKILQNPTTGRRQTEEAPKFLIHLIADLHQPLHVGDNKDQGGNLLQVRFFGEGSNLHRVWDSKVIERHTKNENVWLWDFDFVANPKMVAEWSKGTPEDWATESLWVAKEAYRLPGSGKMLRSGARLDNEYYRYALPVIRVQLAKAGIRTAFVLNAIFR